MSHLSDRSTTSVGRSGRSGRTTLPRYEMDCGCNTLPPCRSMTKPLGCWSLRHDHNQGTHGSDGIVNYERASWRAVKILTVGGFAAVGADTRQGLLVTSSFRGHQRPTCHLADSRDCLKHLSRHRRNSSSSRCQRLPLPKVTKYRGQQLPPDSPFSIFAGSIHADDQYASRPAPIAPLNEPHGQT